MIPVVVVAFALVSSTLAFPFIPPQHVTPDVEGVPHVYAGVPQTVVPEPVKTEGQGSSEVYTSTEQVTHSEKTGVQVPSVTHTSQVYTQEGTVGSKVQNVPVNVEHVQPTYTQTPVLLPIQPLSVVSQGEHVWRPIVVPAEAIADGRVIITSAQPIQQRSLPIIEETYVPQGQTPVEPFEQTGYVQSVEKQTPVQVQGYTPTQVQLKEETVNQQTAPVTQEIQKTVDPVVNQVPVESQHVVQQTVQPVVSGVQHEVYSVDPTVQPVVPVGVQHQVYSVQQNVQPVVPGVQHQVYNVEQNVQSVVPEYVQHQVYSVDQSVQPVVPEGVQHQVHSVDPTVQPVGVQHQVYSVDQSVQPVVPEGVQQNVQSVVPGVQHQVYSVGQNVQSVVPEDVQHEVQTYTGGHTPVTQSNVHEQPAVVGKQGYQEDVVQSQDYPVHPSTVENVKQQVPQTENVEPGYHQQVTEVQVPQEEVNKCGQVQNQPVEQVITTKTETQQYDQGYTSVQTVEPQQQQVQTVEKQVPYQQPVQVQTVEPVHEQFHNVQPVSGSVVDYQTQQQTVEQVKTSEVEPNQEVPTHTVETIHHFGDKIPKVPIHSVPVHSPVQPVQTI